MKKRHFLLLLVIVLLLSAVSSTWGYHKTASPVVNRISTKKSGVTMREVFNPADKWLPGETKEKQVSFSNSGELPQVIRFKCESAWSERSEVVGADATVLTLTQKPTIQFSDTKNWQQVGEWYYYKKALQPGAVTENAISAVKFGSELTNGGYDGKQDYSNKRYTLTVIMEALDVNQIETEAGWGMTFTAAADGVLTWSASNQTP